MISAANTSKAGENLKNVQTTNLAIISLNENSTLRTRPVSPLLSRGGRRARPAGRRGAAPVCTGRLYRRTRDCARGTPHERNTAPRVHRWPAQRRRARRLLLISRRCLRSEAVPFAMARPAQRAGQAALVGRSSPARGYFLSKQRRRRFDSPAAARPTEARDWSVTRRHRPRVANTTATARHRPSATGTPELGCHRV